MQMFLRNQKFHSLEPFNASENSNSADYFIFAYGMFSKQRQTGTPRTLKQAKKSPDWPQWQAALQTELDAISAQQTYMWVPVPKGTKILKTRILYDVKTDNFGNPVKHKCCLILMGNKQTYCDLYYEVFALTTTPEGISTIFAVACACDWDIRQFDFSTAYLSIFIHPASPAGATKQVQLIP